MPSINGSPNPEDPNITTLMSPSSMSHPEQYRDADWVEPAEEPYGTAVFDATGDKAAGADVVRSMANRAKATIVEVEGSHAIMVSQPQAVTDLILTALKAVS